MTDDPGRTQAEAAFGAPGPGRARPSAAGYWLGGVVIALAVAGAITWFVVGMVRFVDALDDLARVDVPGSRVIALGTGRHSIYYEGPGGEDAVVPPLRIRIAGVDGGPVLAVGGHSGSVTYSMGGHAGRSINGFGVPRAGRYRVTVDAAERSGAQIAIGPGVGGRIVRALVGGFAILLVGGGAGAALIVVTGVRRGRAPAA